MPAKLSGMASTEHVLEALDKEQQKNLRYRQKAKEAAELIVHSGAAIAGSVVGGYVDGRYPDKKVLGLPLPTIVGVVACTVGGLKLVGSASDTVWFGGIGMLCGEGWKFGYNKGAPEENRVKGEVGAAPSARGALPPRNDIPTQSELVSRFRALAGR